MNLISRFLGAAASLLVATIGAAHAIPVPVTTVPEPGSIALVGLGIAGVVAFSRRKRK